MYCPSRCSYRTYQRGATNHPLSWGQYRVHGGNLRKFRPTKPHGTAFSPMQWLYQKEAADMESSKMYCPSRCRYRTYQLGAANYPMSWGAVQGQQRKFAKVRAYQTPWYRVSTNAMVISKGQFKNVLPYSVQIPYLPALGRKLPRVMGGSIRSREEICETSGLPIPMVPRLHQCNGYIKRKLWECRVQKCIALVSAGTVLTRPGPKTTLCHRAQYRVQRRNLRNFRPQTPWYRICTNAMVISKGSYRHGEFKNVLP